MSYSPVHTVEQYTADELPIRDYHLHDSASKSTLDLISQAPALVQWSKAAPIDQEADSAVYFGDAFHALVLQPDRFHADFALDFEPPKGAISTVEQIKKEIARWGEKPTGSTRDALVEQMLCLNPDAPLLEKLRAEHAESIGTRSVLTATEYRKACLMRDSIMAHPTAKGLILRDGLVEHSVIWTDKATGARARCRFDKAIPDSGYAIDLKTAGQIDRFASSVIEYRYDVQDAHYSDGYQQAFGHPPKAFLFLAVSSTRSAGRYPVHIFSLPQDWKEEGREKRDRDLYTYAQCKKSGRWPGIQTLDRPKWAK